MGNPDSPPLFGRLSDRCAGRPPSTPDTKLRRKAAPAFPHEDGGASAQQRYLKRGWNGLAGWVAAYRSARGPLTMELEMIDTAKRSGSDALAGPEWSGFDGGPMA